MFETKYYDNFEELKSPPNTVVIYPIFTQSAYDWDSIHDFRKGQCETCKTTEIQNFYEKRYSSSGNAYSVLEFLGYQFITDLDVSQNPSILKNYEKVILLHNEFVSQEEFDAITAHPKVIYLYPHALSSKIWLDLDSNLITFVSGPGYPDGNTKNAFGWSEDNSEFFMDNECQNWEFYPIENGFMLNCYPEKIILEDGFEILKKVRNL